MTLVSIIVPSYNHAPFLRTALAGVLAQTLTDWELILIDDGSTDDSVEIAQEIAAEDPRIQVLVNEENLGTYGTEEKARELSRGKYVAVLNSDDLWEPQKLERQVAALEAHPEAMFAYNLGWKIDESGRVDRNEDVHGDWPKHEVQELLPYLLFENRVLASSVVFRLDRVSFDPGLRYSGDWVALLTQALQGPAVCITERLSYWRMHTHNTFVRSPKQVYEEIRVRHAIESGSWFVRDLPRQQILHGLSANAMNLAALEILRGNRAAGVSAALRAARLAPSRTTYRRLAASLLPNARQRLWPNDTTKFDRPHPSEAPLKIS